MSRLSTIVAGSTGAVGRQYVVNAVQSTQIQRVVALSRRDIMTADFEKTFPGLDLSLAASKLQVVKVDWEALLLSTSPPAKSSELVNLDNLDHKIVEAFSGHDLAVMALGSSVDDCKKLAKAATSPEEKRWKYHYKRCDGEYAAMFAKAVKACSGSNLKHFAQMSCQGAKRGSWFDVLNIKGTADQVSIDQQFARTTFLRPGFIDRLELTNGSSWSEKLMVKTMATVNCKQVASALLTTGLDEATANKQNDHSSSTTDIKREVLPPAYLGDKEIRARAPLSVLEKK